MRLRIFILSIFFSSCVAFHHGSISESTLKDDVSVVEFAHGYAKATRFLGIGGMKRNALIADAKKNLLKANPLEKGQRLANYTIDFTESFFFFGVHTTTVVMTAEIISNAPSGSVQGEIEEENATHYVGQNVYILDTKTYEELNAKILEVSDNIVVVGFEDSKGRYRIKKIHKQLARTKSLK